MRFGDYAAARGYGFPAVRNDEFTHITADTELHAEEGGNTDVDGVSEMEYNFEVLKRHGALVVTNNQYANREKVHAAFQKFLLEIADGDAELAEAITSKLDDRMGFMEYAGDIVIQTALAVIEAKGEEIDEV